MSGPTRAVRPLAAVTLALVLAVAGASCGDDDAPAAERATSTTAGSAGGGGTTSTPPVRGAAAVAVASTGMGDVVVDGEGYTLYVFTPDRRGTPTCVDACASAWPPALTDGAPEAGPRVDGAELGTVERDDGREQVTYGGWPLYRYAADTEPGQTAGQGSGGVWFVIDASGTPVRTDAPDDGSGY